MSERGKEDYDKLVADGKYATRGDLKEEIGTANEQHLLLLTTKIEDLLAQKQTPAIKTRLNRLNKERIKVRKIINDERNPFTMYRFLVLYIKLVAYLFRQ